MAKKIFISGNYLTVEDTNSNKVEIDNLKSKCDYDPISLENDSVKLFYTDPSGLLKEKSYNLSDTVDENSLTYTKRTFKDFVNNNLGV